MANYTVTIRTILLSLFDETGKGIGIIVKDDNTFYHPNEIIDYTYNKFFANMDIPDFCDDYFKKLFLKNFYNREIGYETLSRFLLKLESLINGELYPMLKTLKATREMVEDDIIKNQVSTVSSVSKGENRSVQLQETMPDRATEIVFSDKNGIIKHANHIHENHDKNNNEREVTTANQTTTKFENYMLYASYRDITTRIFELMDSKLFLQVF